MWFIITFYMSQLYIINRLNVLTFKSYILDKFSKLKFTSTIFFSNPLGCTIQLWGTFKKSNSQKIQVLQSKSYLTHNQYAPPCIPSHILHIDLRTFLKSLKQTNYRYYFKFRKRLENHTNSCVKKYTAYF